MADPFDSRLRYPLFGLLVVVWGLNYLFVKAGLPLCPPLWLAAFRAGLGAAVLAVFLLSAPVRRSLDARGCRDALLIGVPSTGLFFGLWFVAAASVAPGVTAVLIYTFPLWVALLSAPVLHQRLGGAEWLAIAVGFAGVVLVAQPWQGAGSAVPPVAFLELLLAALSWAVGTVLFQRRFRREEYTAATIYQMIGGAALLLALAFGVDGSQLPSATPELVGIVLWLGVMGTALAYLIWYALLARSRAATLSAYVFLVPIVALGASVLLFEESLSPVQVLGVVVVVGALALLGFQTAQGGGRGSHRTGVTPASERGPPVPPEHAGQPE